MQLSSLLLAAGLGALLSAAPAGAPKPAQSLQLGKTEKLDGTIALPNHNTLLFIPDGEKNAVRVLAVSPTGQPVWESALVKTHHLLGTVNMWKAMGGGDMETRSMLAPVRVFSAGNTLFAAEFIYDDNKELHLKEGQLVMQQIDEQGKVARHDFTLPVAPKKVDRATLGNYAAADGFYLITQYTNEREETVKYYLERYNAVTKQAQQLPLDLPKPYVTKHEDRVFHDWVLGGHRAGKTYFYRALRGTLPKDNPSKFPVEYEFRIFDNSAKPVGGFTTALHQQLSAGSFVNYSGPMTHFPLQGHVAHIITKTSSSGNGRSTRSTSYDTYDISTGGLGDVLFDPASDDIYIGGEYGSYTYDPASQQNILGTFVVKLHSDGTLVSKVQTPYTPEIKKDSKFLTSSYYDNRRAALSLNPVNHDVLLEFEQAKRNVVVAYDADLKLISQQNLPFKLVPAHNMWQMGQAFAALQNMGNAQTELPGQYAAAAKAGYSHKVYDLTLRTKPDPKAKDDEQPYYYFQPQANDGVLVIRAPYKTGAKVDIYAL